MARRTPKYPMGLQNNGKNSDRTNAIPNDIQNQSSRPSRDWNDDLPHSHVRRLAKWQIDLSQLVPSWRSPWTSWGKNEEIPEKKWPITNNTKVKARQFEVGDLVLRKVTIATKNHTQGKLGPNWEGPYKVIEIHRRGTYHLEAMDGKWLPHPWNIEHLKKYYP